VDKIVEKKVEDTARIYLLQNEMTELKRQFEVEKNKPPREVIVEKRIEVPVEKIVEKNVEDISRIFMLQNEIAELNKKLGERKTRPVRKQEVKRKVYRVAKTDYKMYSGIYGKKIVADDLKLVEGIGPVIEKLFHASGLKTWKQVANTKAEKLKEILDKGGRRFQVHNPATWPAQCQMMVDDKWEELKVYQDKLNRGKE
jgi:predicted flap endonuclease-1-like 5' DNA nuclease